MIDLHAHVLPAIDDGPGDMDESVELLRAAAAHGTRTIAATPHLRGDHPAVEPARLAEQCAQVMERIPAGIDIRVVPGGEVDMLWAKEASDEELRLVSFGQRGSDLLVETPYGELPATFDELLFQISARGYRVLLAHPERNPTFQRDPERLRQLVTRGVLTQVTLPAVASAERRSRSRKLALAMVREGLAHNLASDAHSGGPWRGPDLRAGLEALAEIAPARAEWMVTDAAAAVLEGEPLPQPPRERAGGKRRWLSRRRG